MKNEKDEILTTAACFRQRVNLPAAQVAGLADTELATALCFEIEPFSGIPQAQCELAWVKLTGSDVTRAAFDVVQIRRADLASELEHARAAKRRVKFVTAMPQTGESVEQLPKIPARTQRSSRKSPWLWWAVLCVCALGALVYDTWTIRSQARKLQQRVAVQHRLQAEKNALAEQISSIQKESQSLRQQRIDAARAQQNVEALRGAWPILLAAVPKACRDESVVRQIAASGAYSATISGVALSTEAASRTLLRLTEVLRSPASGWRVKPGRIGAAADGGTVEFSCEVVFDEEGQFR